MSDSTTAAAEDYAKRRLPEIGVGSVLWQQELGVAFAAGARWAFEQAARMFTSGQYCRLADHMQGICDCAEIAARIRARAAGEGASK